MREGGASRRGLPATDWLVFHHVRCCTFPHTICRIHALQDKPLPGVGLERLELIHELLESLHWLASAGFDPGDELSHIHPPVGYLAVVHPGLRLPELLAESSLS